MLTAPTAPSPGKPISAGFFSRLIAWVKSGHPIERPGYRLRRGPNGTSLVLDRSTKAKSPLTTGCFAIDEIDTENKSVKLINCYYQIGGYTYNDKYTMSGLWSSQCTVEDELAYLCLVLPSERTRDRISLTWYNWDMLTNEQEIYSKYIIPLYAFETSEKEEGEKEEGEQKEKFKFNLYLDMRNAPRAQMLEYTVE